jgi:hypothetical protein
MRKLTILAMLASGLMACDDFRSTSTNTSPAPQALTSHPRWRGCLNCCKQLFERGLPLSDCIHDVQLGRGVCCDKCPGCESGGSGIVDGGAADLRRDGGGANPFP